MTAPVYLNTPKVKAKGTYTSNLLIQKGMKNMKRRSRITPVQGSAKRLENGVYSYFSPHIQHCRLAFRKLYILLEKGGQCMTKAVKKRFSCLRVNPLSVMKKIELVCDDFRIASDPFYRFKKINQYLMAGDGGPHLYVRNVFFQRS